MKQNEKLIGIHETEHNFFKRLRPEHGVYPAKSIARKQAMLRDLYDAENISDMKIIIKRIITNE